MERLVGDATKKDPIIPFGHQQKIKFRIFHSNLGKQRTKLCNTNTERIIYVFFMSIKFYHLVFVAAVLKAVHIQGNNMTWVPGNSMDMLR